MQEALEWMRWLVGLVLLPFIWNVSKKADRIAENSVKRDEYNGTISSIRQEIRDGNKAIIDQINQTIRILMESRK